MTDDRNRGYKRKVPPYDFFFFISKSNYSNKKYNHYPYQVLYAPNLT